MLENYNNNNYSFHTTGRCIVQNIFLFSRKYLSPTQNLWWQRQHAKQSKWYTKSCARITISNAGIVFSHAGQKPVWPNNLRERKEIIYYFQINFCINNNRLELAGEMVLKLFKSFIAIGHHCSNRPNDWRSCSRDI
jgi:hypothetical protein